MAISVKDIQEKQFSTQVSNGYNVEQVDDFLDELAEQLGALIRENLALTGQVRQLEESVRTAQAEAEDAKKRLPDYNEAEYFRNLEKSIREALIGAQRIADEAVESAKAQAEKTVSEANAKAEKTVSDANAQAEKTVTDANALAEKTVADAEARARETTDTAEQTVAALRTEMETLRGNIDTYRENFKRIMRQQMAALGE